MRQSLTTPRDTDSEAAGLRSLSGTAVTAADRDITAQARSVADLDHVLDRLSRRFLILARKRPAAQPC